MTFTFPANRWSEPGWRVMCSGTVTVLPGCKAELQFAVRDSFDGVGSGYHYAVEGVWADGRTDQGSAAADYHVRTGKQCTRPDTSRC
jgi:hypothetical protein